MSRLYFKWRDISSDEEMSDEDLEEQLRRYGPISNKIEEVAKIMDSRGFTEFVKTDDDLRGTISEGYPSLDIDNLTTSFQKNLF